MSLSLFGCLVITDLVSQRPAVINTPFSRRMTGHGSSLSTVPPELVSIIFEHAKWSCSRKELACVALTCSYLHQTVAPPLYRTVIADDERFLHAGREVTRVVLVITAI